MIRDWSGQVILPDLDVAGDPIPTACECDEGRACSFPPCVREQDEQEAYWRAYFGRVAQERESTEALMQDLWDAGRGHLLMAEVDFYEEASA